VYPSSFYTSDPELGGSEVGSLMLCQKHINRPGLASAYFLSYITLTTFCIIPLFVGAMLISMADCVEIMKRSQRRAERQAALAILDTRIEQASARHLLSRQMKIAVKLLHMAFGGLDLSERVSLIAEKEPNSPRFLAHLGIGRNPAVSVTARQLGRVSCGCSH
jgi:hypothetical protein